MIIEIGTSDFRTEAGIKEGLFIEPVKEHFDRLPDCNKENVAISNYEGEIKIFYTPLSIIEKYKLPNWVRGCNSIGHLHPTIVAYGWTEFVKSQVVQVVRIKSLIDKYNITEIDLLKIDTEGHDCVILNDFLDTVDILPNTIQFENNILSNGEEVAKVVVRLIDLDYKCKNVNTDIVCRL